MAGTRLSLLNSATTLLNTDFTYLVNNGSPRKLTLQKLIEFISSQTEFVKTINGVSATENILTLTKANIGLGDVPNTNPVTSLNTVKGDITLSGATNKIDITISDHTFTFTVSPNFTLDWSKLTGSWVTQTALATTLSNLGAQIDIRVVDSSSGVALILDDIKRTWVDANFLTDTELTLSAIGASAGAMIEIRQKGAGKVTVVSGDAYTFINTPYGTWSQTNGVGTRIQLVCLGNNVWEFK
jgi:hypothetical protein